MKHLGYAHIKSSAVDHEVKDVAFGGTITLWCDWSTAGLRFSQEPRVKSRVCMDCTNAKRAAVKAETREKLAAARPIQRDIEERFRKAETVIVPADYAQQFRAAVLAEPGPFMSVNITDKIGLPKTIDGKVHEGYVGALIRDLSASGVIARVGLDMNRHAANVTLWQRARPQEIPY